MKDAREALAPFERAWSALLTSYRRDGTPVTTPVNVAVAGERAYVRTYESAGKVKRMRRNPVVQLAPATWRGEPAGASVSAVARLLEGEESEAAGRLIDAKHPFFQRRFVRFGHRVRRQRTVHFELTPEPARATGSAAAADLARAA